MIAHCHTLLTLQAAFIHSHLLLAMPVATLFASSADGTGIGNAMTSLATLLAGFVVGPVTIALVVEGYHYMFSDSSMRGMHLKRAIGIIVIGTALVIFAVTLAPQLITTLTPSPTSTPTPTAH
jgi:uncharacterized membrane-anchored protein